MKCRIEDLRKYLNREKIDKLNEANVIIKKEMEDQDGVVREVLDMLLSIATYRPISPAFARVCLDFAERANNWNDEKDKKMDRDTNILGALITQHLTLVQTVNLMKKQNRRTQAINRNSSFESSRAYLKELRKELEDDNR